VKPKRNKQVWRYIHRWEDNIKMDLKETVDWSVNALNLSEEIYTPVLNL
jgi:hypothetical protein